VAGLATFGNSSNTGTLGVAGAATFSNVTINGTLSGAGAPSPSTWYNYTAGSNVNMGGYSILSGYISNVAGTISQPGLFVKADTGYGASDPTNFTVWRGTWVKHTGSSNNQNFTIDCTSASGGWNIQSVWEGVMYTDISFTAGTVYFNSGIAVNSGATFSNTVNCKSNVTLTGGTSSYLSNSGILSNTGAAAYFQNTSNTGTLGVAGAATFASNIAINQTSPGTGFQFDVNGISRGAVYYSTMTTGGTLTITTNNNYGVYYNITAAGTYTVQVEATQQTSNIGKYYVFRNNTGSALSVTLTNATGITSPITIGSNASATIVVAGVTSYALF
jgi:hypothetical protein